MLKSSLLVFATALLVIVCLPIMGRNPQAASPAPVQSAAPAPAPTGKPPAKPTAESKARAKMLYTRDCALCHGDSGNGKNDMNFTLDNWTNSNTLANKLDSDLFTIIRNGKGQMPAEDAGRANDTEVWNLISYIRALPRTELPAPAPAAAPAPAEAPAPPPADAPAPAPAPAPPTN
jgi:mono/diheme cytochrome c family protein